MEESILDSIKKFVGVSVDDDAFDDELIMIVNGIFMTLQQIGVGSQSTLFHIEDNSSTWSDYLENPTELPMVQTYTAIRTRLVFDPPQSSTLEQALRQEVAEYEWRLNVKVDDYHVEEDSNDGGTD